MTPEQERAARRCAEWRVELKTTMSAAPRAVIDGGATRAQAWKKARLEAERVIEREPVDHVPYMEATIRLQRCATAPVEELAEQLYDEQS